MSFLGRKPGFLRVFAVAATCMFMGFSSANAIYYKCSENGTQSQLYGTIEGYLCKDAVNVASTSNADGWPNARYCWTHEVRSPAQVGCSTPSGKQFAGWRLRDVPAVYNNGHCSFSKSGLSNWLFSPGKRIVVGGLFATNSCTTAGGSLGGTAGYHEGDLAAIRSISPESVLEAVWVDAGCTFGMDVDVRAGTEYSITVSANKLFDINWGDGNVTQVHDPFNNASQTYSHTYSSPGRFTICIDGYAPGGYNRYGPVIQFNTALKSAITGIKGSLGAIFSSSHIELHDCDDWGTIQGDHALPSYNDLFNGATNLTGAIPEHLFAGNPIHAPDPPKHCSSNGQVYYSDSRIPLYQNVFKGTGVSGSIPAYLFGNDFDRMAAVSNDETFYNIWYNPSNYNMVITDAWDGMFWGTFRDTPNLTGPIPETLFGGNTSSGSTLGGNIIGMGVFYKTFSGSKVSGNIPEKLFEKTRRSTCFGYASNGACSIDVAANQMFSYTFADSDVSGVIPARLFSNINQVSNPCAIYGLFEGTFNSCENLTSYIRPDTFPVCNPFDSNFMSNIFRGASNMSTICPANMTDYRAYNPLKNAFWYRGQSNDPSNRVVSCIPDNVPWEVSLDPRGGSGGTSGPLYYYCNTYGNPCGWSLDNYGDDGEIGVWDLQQITPPTREGWTFWGYGTQPNEIEVTSITGSGHLYFDQNGDLGPLTNGYTISGHTLGAQWFRDCAPLDNLAECRRSIKEIHTSNPQYPNWSINYVTTCPPGYMVGNNDAYNPYCIAPTTTITLNSEGATTHGTEAVYAVYGDAVYLDAGTEYQMLPTNNNLIDAPTKVYSVNYVPNGGVVNLTSENTDANLSFLGYFETSSSNVAFISDKRSITADGVTAGTTSTTDQTWVAHWAASGTVTLPTATRRGYYFNGWCRDAALNDCGGGTSGSSLTVTSDNVTMYAKWTRMVYQITLNDNDADTDGSPDVVYLAYDDGFYLERSAINPISSLDRTPGKAHATFRGYYYNTAQSSQGGGRGIGHMIQIINRDGDFLPNTTFTDEDTEISAMFGADIYQITLDPNGGTTTDDTIWLKFGNGQGFNFYDDDSATIVIGDVSIPTRDGYAFQGYIYYPVDASGASASSPVELVDYLGRLTQNYSDVSDIRDDMTAVAVWEPVFYPVHFDNNGGTGGMGAINGGTGNAYLRYGEGFYSSDNLSDYITPPLSAPNKTGYVFAGYYHTSSVRSGDSGGGQSQIVQIVDSHGYISGPLTFTTDSENAAELVAHWNPQIYAITLNDNGGDGGRPRTLYLHYSIGLIRNVDGTDPVEYLDQMPSRTGYRFTGYWYTGLSGTTQIFNAHGHVMPNISDFTDIDTTIVAGWEPLVFEITLDDNGGNGGAPSPFYLKYGDGWYSNAAATTPLQSPITRPSRQGYTFAGYYNTLSGGIRGGETGGAGSWIQIVGADGNMVTTDEAKTFTLRDTNIYAAWNPSCNAVSLNANGGTVGTVSTLYKRSGETTWYIDSNCETEWVGASSGDVKPTKTVGGVKYIFRGFYETIPMGSNNSPEVNVEANSVWPVAPHISFDGNPTEEGTYWMVDQNTTLYAAWARDCVANPTNATCDLDIDVNGNVTYTTDCVEGGYIPISGVGTYNPVCNMRCNTITLDDSSRGGSTNRTLYKLTNDTRWYSQNVNGVCTNEVTQVSAPTKTGASFTRYVYPRFSETVGSGSPVILSNSWTVSADTTIVAHYDCDEGFYTGNNPDISGVCNPNIYNITLNDNGNGDIVTNGNGHVYEVYNTYWSLNSSGSPALALDSPHLTLTPSRGSDYLFLGYFMNQTSTIEATGRPSGTLFVRPDLLIEQDTDVFDGSSTVYAAWARNCVANPVNATCSVSVAQDYSNDLSVHPGDVTYTTACSPVNGYTPNSGTSGTYNPSCSPNEININWQENNENGAVLPNGQCTYDGDLTLPAAPVYAGHDFMYWKLASGSNNPYQSANTTVTDGCVYNNVGVYSGTSTAINAIWCNTCVPGANVESCSVSYDTINEECVYTPHCYTGYTLDNNLAHDYEPSCHANSYTITYKAGSGATGANVTQSVTYNAQFTTYGYPQTQFAKSGSILKSWSPNLLQGGGNYTLLNHEYSKYDVTNNTELTGVWAQCSCDYSDVSVTSCVAANPSVSNNQCQFVVTCATGYAQSTASYTCEDENCTAMCGGDNYTITLNSNSATVGGTKQIYTTKADHVYRNAARTSANIMATDANPLSESPYSLPQRAYTVTYNVGGGTLAPGASSTATATYTFDGYYDAASGQNTTQYIGSTGYITQAGIDAGTAYTANATWYAHWSGGSVTLPNATRAGYTFGGWYTDEGLTTPANGYNAGTSYSPTADVTLYAKWDVCTAGNYCPGIDPADQDTPCPTGYTSVVGASAQSECYVNCAAGTGVLTANSTCSTLTGSVYKVGSCKVYYGSTTPTDVDTDKPGACTIYNCPTNYTISGSGVSYHDERRDCKRTINLYKNSGSGTLSGTNVTDTNGGTSAARIICYAGQDCVFPNTSGILIKDGYDFIDTWRLTNGVGGEGCVASVNTPENNIYYACKTAQDYIVPLKQNHDNSDEEIVNYIGVTFQKVVPPVDINGETLVPLSQWQSNDKKTTFSFAGYFSDRLSTVKKYYTATMGRYGTWTTAGSVPIYAQWKMTCAAGYYLPAGGRSCVACLGKDDNVPQLQHYCPGPAGLPNANPAQVPPYAYSSTDDQGISACPTGYGDGGGGTVAESGCIKNVPAGSYVATAYGAAVACSAGYTSSAHTVHYGETSSCSPISVSCTEGTYLHVVKDANENVVSYSCVTCPAYTAQGHWYCPGGAWTFDGEDHGKNDCPDVVAKQRQDWSWLASEYHTPVTVVSVNATPAGQSNINQCLALNTVTSPVAGQLHEHVVYRPVTDTYDYRMRMGWFKVNPGYYMHQKKSCGDTFGQGAYAYYRYASKCPAGGYCAGVTTPEACSDPANQPDTLGLAVCANNYYSDEGASACTQCNTTNGYHTVTHTHNSSTLTDGHFALHAGVSSCKITCGAGACVSSPSGACANVGISGWSAGETISQGQTNCHSCSVGLVTSGFGFGADEVSDCGHILHIGDKQVYLRSGRKTSPSLNVKIDKNVFYGNMYELTKDITGNVKMSYADQTYVVCDETGEVCTGI